MNISKIAGAAPSFNGKILMQGMFKEAANYSQHSPYDKRRPISFPPNHYGVKQLDEGKYSIDTESVKKIDLDHQRFVLDTSTSHGIPAEAYMYWNTGSIKTNYRDVLAAYTAASSGDADVTLAQQ